MTFRWLRCGGSEFRWHIGGAVFMGQGDLALLSDGNSRNRSSWWPETVVARPPVRVWSPAAEAARPLRVVRRPRRTFDLVCFLHRFG